MKRQPTTALLVSTPQAPGGNYIAGLAELLHCGVFEGLEPGAFVLEVEHDESCPIFSGGRCSCEPAFALRHLEELL